MLQASVINRCWNEWAKVWWEKGVCMMPKYLHKKCLLITKRKIITVPEVGWQTPFTVIKGNITCSERHNNITYSLILWAEKGTFPPLWHSCSKCIIPIYLWENISSKPKLRDATNSWSEPFKNIKIIER